MIKPTLIACLISLAVLLMNCGKEENVKLQSQVDSLNAELENSQQFAITLAEVGMLMDSIDANRHVLRINMLEGLTFVNYTSRMEELNNYVKETEKKISGLENVNKEPKPNATYFTVILKNLKEDIEKKNQEIANIQVMVARLQTTTPKAISLGR